MFFFLVDPGQPESTHLTHDPVTGPGRVLKLWLGVPAFSQQNYDFSDVDWHVCL